MFQNIALITQIGLSMITPILLGVFIGGFIDDKVGTKMVFRLIFIVLGVGASFLQLFKIAGTKNNKLK